MKLQADAIIAREKITDYLLKWRPDHDKSQFLAYGELWKIRGTLKGPNGISISVVTIWMKEKYTGLTKFITLFPDKEG